MAKEREAAATAIVAGAPASSVAGDDQHQGAGRFGLLDLPEPVVSADSNFNRGVSVTEFRQAAASRFMALDLDHHGYLTLAGLEVIRPAPPSGPKRVRNARLRMKAHCQTIRRAEDSRRSTDVIAPSSSSLPGAL